MKKTIIFDVDWVITDSWTKKEKIIGGVLEKYGLLKLPWVEKILSVGLNRILLLEKIYKIQKFDTIKVLREINSKLLPLETSLILIDEVANFIKKNYEKYEFFTNTSMPKIKLQMIFENHKLSQYFTELLAYEDGTKKENVEYILRNYNIEANNTLFIDDKISHIDYVKITWVKTLLYQQDDISFEKKIKNIFQ